MTLQIWTFLCSFDTFLVQMVHWSLKECCKKLTSENIILCCVESIFYHSPFLAQHVSCIPSYSWGCVFLLQRLVDDANLKHKWVNAGRPVGRYYRPLVDNRPFCLNGRYSWICGRYCIKMVDISSKSLRMVIDFPYYLKYDKSQDLKVYYSAIKWRNMKISTSTLFYMYLLGSRIVSQNVYIRTF